MPKFGLSQSVRRKEDKRFLTGTGDYLDDNAPEGALHAAFFRSPVGHGRIVGLDVSAARAIPGVVAVFTAADLAGKLDNGMDFELIHNRDGSPGAAPRRPILADDVARYAGEAIAVVLAETRTAALDAIDAIACDFEDLPVHVETATGGETIHPEAPDNLAYDWVFGDEAATEAAFAAAAHRTKLELVNNRVMGMSMEPRGCWAEWDGRRIHVAYSGQGVWMLKDELAKRMGLPKTDVRVTTPDVGGGFGIKTFNYPEYFAVAFAARELNRPVRWMCGRGEAMLTDNGGRDHVTTAEAAFDADLKLVAVRVDCVSNLGAYNSAFGQYIASDVALKVMPGVYDFQTAFVNVKGVFTNTTPVDAYRGAGRPESIYTIERLMDWSARELGVDALELRRRSFIPRKSFPYRTVVGELYDVGDFERVLDRAVAEADLGGFAARRAASAAAGRLRGLGLCYYIESILGDDREGATIAFAADGMVEIYAGTQSNGQGHETVFAQFLHERAGIPFDRIRYVQGDSDRIAWGGGTGGSRSVTLQGNAINQAADEVIARFRPLAEEELEVARADLVWEEGAFRVAGTDRAVDLLQLAETARAKGLTGLLVTETKYKVPGRSYPNGAHFADLVWEEGAFRVAGTDRAVDLLQLAETARAKGLTGLLVTETKYKVPGRSYPNGAHFAEVEVDPETGSVRIDRYTVVDDFGFLVNPMLAEGQVHGGVAQGFGQAVTERVVYSPEGQLLSGSFMDYAMPRANDLPDIVFRTELVPSTANETGMKGCGEAGTVGALAAVTNATLDALWETGVRHVDMPLTPSRVWSWIDGVRLAAE